jgi:serralysin
MCGICEMVGFNIHSSDGSQSPGEPLSNPTEHKTPAQGGAYLNRDLATWNHGALATPTELTFAFRNTGVGANPTSEPLFTRFSATQINLATLALQSWADVSNLTFTRVSGSGPGSAYSDNATLRFGNFERPGGAGAAHAYLPFDNRSANAVDGDVWVNVAYAYEKNPEMWEYGMQTLTHEIGHALGFSHPGDYNAGAGGNITYADDAEFIEDTRQWTVMSYFSETNTGANFQGYYSPAPLMIDIAAAQRLYGANLDFQTGNTVYGFNSNAERVWYQAPDGHAPIFCAWDAGGVDTFDFSGYAVKQYIDLRNGTFSDVGGMKGNVSISAGVKVDGVIVNIIENAIGGSAKDTIIGNNEGNTLDGRAGDDVLSGGKGNDVLIGGDGADLLAGAKGFDTFTGGLGADTLSGAANNDTFIYKTLADSEVGAEDYIQKGLDRLDKIDLSAIDAVVGSGNQAFHLGGAAFTGSAGELIRFYHAGSDTTYIQGDVDGDGDADISIAVQGDSHTFLNFVY